MKKGKIEGYQLIWGFDGIHMRTEEERYQLELKQENFYRQLEEDDFGGLKDWIRRREQKKKRASKNVKE